MCRSLRFIGRSAVLTITLLAAQGAWCASPCSSPAEGGVTATFTPTQYTPQKALVVSLLAHQYSWGTHVKIQDTTPAGWAVVAGSLSPSGSVAGGAVVWDVPLSPGLCQAFTYTITPPASASGSAAYSAVVTFSSDSNSQAGTWKRSVTQAPCSIPAAPSLTSPSAGQVLPAGTTSATLSWAASPGANTYNVDFGTISPPPLLQSTANTSLSVPVTSGQTYYFRVFAHSGCGTAASAIRSFSVATCPAPGGATLLAPADGAKVAGSSVGLSWSSVSGATAYDVFFGSASPPALFQTVTTTSLVAPITPGVTYYWKVAASNACGSTGSQQRSFAATPAAPVTAADLHVVGAAHASGIGGTAWRTDLEVCNRAATQGAYTVALLVRGQPNPSPTFKSYTLDGGKCIRYQDALQTLFGFSGAASLRVTPQGGVLVTSSRTYNQTVGGTFGGFAVAQGLAQAVSPGHDGLLIQLGQSVAPGTGFRTNVALENLTAARLVASVDLYASTGELLGTVNTTLEPYEATQLTEAFKLVTPSDVADGFAVVRTATQGGALLAEASVIDNRSGDVAVVQPIAQAASQAPGP
jgi:hypothetical protein